MDALSAWLRRGAAVAFVLCAIAVLALALMPVQPRPEGPWDKANHFVAFAVLGVLGLAAWRQAPRVMAWLLAYGVAIELLQGLTATREADWQDVVADAIGLAFAWALASLAQRWTARRQA